MVSKYHFVKLSHHDQALLLLIRKSAYVLVTVCECHLDICCRNVYV